MLRRVAIFLCAAAMGTLVSIAPANEQNEPPTFDGGTGAAPPAGTLNIKDQVLSQVGIDQKLDNQIPADATFNDENGNPVKLGDYYGKRPIILMFVQYNCPMLCTPALNDLCRAMNSMVLDPGTDYDLVTISFNPHEDYKLAFLKKRIYVSQVAKSDMAKGAWHFLTGSDDQIHRVTDAAGFKYLYDAKNDQYVHVTGLMVLTPEGKVSKYFYGLEYGPNDLRLAIAEADESHIGSLATELLMYCCQYDPQTGKYDLAVKNLLRLGGSVTLAILAGFMSLQFARDRGRKVTNSGATGQDGLSSENGTEDGQSTEDQGPAK